ncbi:LLM class flavin-dependent oxidoreductase [Nocardia caishijiensis]|uniref:Alkanesulfonate monooxygenase n=1 Tax=Nocardia caishijiensis TaxID=184756 RepID=A0ABQ6YIC5_9NOCA|nr:LLM class flavin-dependent oxidoreductase [Nocardia caishijiensis]KAF0845535.1 alkanesulfonate monooxygenase [Nocardia caishijiensis]
MTEFLWRLPSRGDGRRADPARRGRGGFGPRPGGVETTDVRPDRFGPFDELAQIVDAAELTGFDGVLAPYDPLGEESWIVAAAALRATRYARVTVEFQPAFGTPVYAAKVSATLQRHSAGRLNWRLAVDTDEAEARTRGDLLTGAERYDRAAEFLTVARGVWNETEVGAAGFAGTGFDYAGRYYDVADGGFRGILSGLPFPEVQLSGTTPAALALSAAHADLHLFAEQVEGISGVVADLAQRSAAAGRDVRVGLELPIIARETEDEAWARVHRLWNELDRSDTVADHALGAGRWAGFEAFGYDQRIGLVGSYAQVAQQLSTYAADGVRTFVLSGHPAIEEIHRAGEHLLFLADPSGRTLAQELTA